MCSNLMGRNSDHVAVTNHPLKNVLDIRVQGQNDLLLQLIQLQTQSPEACYDFAVHIVCLVAAPPCNPNTSAPLLLCPETCLALDRLISRGLCEEFSSGLIQHLELSDMESTRAVAPFFLAFNCSDPSTYIQNSTLDMCSNPLSPCTNLLSPDIQGII